MMSEKMRKRGFSLVLTAVLIFSFAAVISALLAFSIGDYKLERARGEKTRLIYAARSGLAVASERLFSLSGKAFTSLADIESAGTRFFLGDIEVQVRVEDENGKLFAALLEDAPLPPGAEDALASLVTSYGDRRLNLNTAGPEILALLFQDPSEAGAFEKERRENPLANMSECAFLQQEYLLSPLPVKNLAFTVKSNYFTIISRAACSGQKTELKAVFHVTGKTVKQLSFEKAY